jgi:hypothetical protein
MNPVYISIGSQCATATVFENLGIKKETLPFDWMFSTPKFIYTILKLLMVDKMETSRIVDDHFFCCNKRASVVDGRSRHIMNPAGKTLVNSKYDVCFPHDVPSDREKYIRRVERLRSIILDPKNFLYFVYISPSSPSSGNFTINGKEPIQDLRYYLNAIDDILRQFARNYKICVYDTFPRDVRQLHPNIVYNKIQHRPGWRKLVQFVTPMLQRLLQLQKNNKQ